MKIYKKIPIIFLFLCFISCNDWLNVKPENEATEEELFSTAYGYRSAINGLYKSMSSGTLYGKELGYGMLDCLSQQYDFSRGTQFSYRVEYIHASRYLYEEEKVNSIIEKIWVNAFNIIANANNIINNVENENTSIFPEGELEKNLILGEAYACRAFIHLDLLRLFAPAPVINDNSAYVPYIESYPQLHGEALAVKPFLDKVIKDLEIAKDLVIQHDTTDFGKASLITSKARFGKFQEDYITNSEAASSYLPSFFRGRGYRMNYYAIVGTLARAHQYAGNYYEAYLYAKEIIDLDLRVLNTSSAPFRTDDYTGVRAINVANKTDYKIKSNLIFGVYYGEPLLSSSDIELNIHFQTIPKNNGYTQWFILNHENQKTFYNSDGMDEFDTDYRGNSMTFLGSLNNIQCPLSVKFYIDGDNSNEELKTIPLMRGTEMKYIMAEYYARQGEFGEAENIINGIRNNRGCQHEVSISSWNQFQDELIREAKREWIGEGQLFYLYKRLNANIDFGDGVIRPLKRSEYLVPIPASENY